MRNALLATVLLVPALALANGYEVPNVNPRELAMVSSAVAAQNAEASATNVNPAALSKIEGLSFSLAGSLLTLTTDWSAPAGSGITPTTASTNLHPVPPVSLFAAYGTKLAALGDRGVGVGFGMGNPAGGNMFWDENWPGRGRILDVERRFYGFYLQGGVELIPDMLRIGGGPIYYYATQYLKQAVQPIPGAYAELETKGGGWAWEAATEIKPIRSIPFTIGVDYKHKGGTSQTGKANFNVPASLESQTIQDQDVTTTLTMPNILYVGAGYRPFKPLLLTFAWSLSRFVVYQQDLFVGSTGLSIVVPRDYRNGYGLRFGAEWDVNKAWTVRGGLFRDHSGLRTRTISPTLPDSNSWIGAVGASYRVRSNFAVNGGFYYADRDRVTSTEWRSETNPAGSFPGSYKTHAYIVSLGITYNTDLGMGAEKASSSTVPGEQSR